jgi:hypothetical protein
MLTSSQGSFRKPSDRVAPNHLVKACLEPAQALKAMVGGAVQTLKTNPNLPEKIAAIGRRSQPTTFQEAALDRRSHLLFLLDFADRPMNSVSGQQNWMIR